MNLRHISPAIFALAIISANADDVLTKEITIEREIVPEVRAVNRPDAYPKTLQFGGQQTELDYLDSRVLAEINPEFIPLEPAPTNPAAPQTPYRGYLVAGYFPVANSSLSAGYSPISTNTTNLHVWEQFSSRYYNGLVSPDRVSRTLYSLDNTIGARLSHSFNHCGTLGVATSLSYSNFSRPEYFFSDAMGDPDAPTGCQGVLRYNLNLSWHGSIDKRTSYHAGADFGLFNFIKGTLRQQQIPFTPQITFENIRPAHQTDFNFNFGITRATARYSSLGIDVATSLLASSFANPTDYSSTHNTHGLVTLKPYYRFSKPNGLTIDLGARCDFTLNAPKSDPAYSHHVFHISPDVLISVAPASWFGAWTRLNGGMQLNSLKSLWEFSRFISPTHIYQGSNIPLIADIGLRFGPVKGASLTFKASYGMANNWLMPVQRQGTICFDTYNLRSWKTEVALNWSYRSLFTIDARYEASLGAPGNANRQWLFWRDRARHVVSASATVRPISPLTIDLGYQLRTGRQMPDCFVTTHVEYKSLGIVSNLTAGAAWSFSPALTAFIRGENLLNKKYFIEPYLPSQGITALVGASWKF